MDGGGLTAGSAGIGGSDPGSDGGSMPIVDFSDVTAVVPSSGCGATPPASGTYTIQTTGSKPADCLDALCGDWASEREYTVFLPQDYDPNHPYTLVFLGPGCGGNGTTIYSIENNAQETAIRVGLTPSAEIQAVHATNPNQGCFDDRDGDASVDFVLYETLYDSLESQLCFDRNRVFTGGNSTGGLMANELGCKYAGDSQRPIRGVMASKGSLPEVPEQRPTCSGAPMAGMWINGIDDAGFPFATTIAAIDLAISYNDCAEGASYDTAVFENFPVGGGLPEDLCKRITGCDPLYPLVVCAIPGSGSHTSFDSIANPGFSTFLQRFLMDPLVAVSPAAP
jgi:predicted esterase